MLIVFEECSTVREEMDSSRVRDVRANKFRMMEQEDRDKVLFVDM